MQMFEQIYDCYDLSPKFINHQKISLHLDLKKIDYTSVIVGL